MKNLSSPYKKTIKFLSIIIALGILTAPPTNAASYGEYIYYDENNNVITPTPPEQSVARQWSEAILEGLPYDLSRPTVHARNLFHLSAAMWDAWAAYDTTASTYLHHERPEIAPEHIQKHRETAISFAAYRLLSHRYSLSYSPHVPPETERIWAIFDNLMIELGLDKNNRSLKGDSPEALGNRIAQTYIDHGLKDGARETDDYNNEHYRAANGVLVPVIDGASNLHDPNRWQPIAMNSRLGQSGEVLWDKDRIFTGAEWGEVTPFSLTKDDLDIYERDGHKYKVYHDPGPPPLLGTQKEKDYRWGFEMVAIWSSHLDPNNNSPMWDISPAAIGNATLSDDPDDFRRFYNFYAGGDRAPGHSQNPVTGKNYKLQIVPRADYARTVAEFWADGADSETPAGHWLNIANYVMDHPKFERRLYGKGEIIDPLEWDVKTYFLLSSTMHDAAIAAWSIKGWYDYVRPMSAIRYLASLGQRSHPNKPSYNPEGINLHPGIIELITEQSTKPGQRHEGLKGNEGKIALYGWRGSEYIEDKDIHTAGVDWILAEQWRPYQRPDFITPPFAGYVSGHSTYSRAAALAMEKLTGSPYFPGGIGAFKCPKDKCFVFEKGPSTDVILQWASYVDAADQCSLSRIWGGIHPPADDLPGRLIGEKISDQAFALTKKYWEGRIKP